MIHGFVHFFVSLPGVFVLAALDSLFFFTLPLGIDAVVMLLAARRGFHVWTTPLLATAGSLVGAAVTYWAGAKLGDAGVGHYTGRKWLTTVKARLRGSAIALAALDLVPPPFPFSVFVLGAGAAKTDRKKFFVTLTVCRLIRFGGEAWLGQRYGQYALRWLESETAERVVFALVVLAIAAGLVSLGRLRRGRVTAVASTARGRRPGGRSPRRNRSRAFSPSSR
jgi:membrane protein YqaA with SNARE-associated domain